MASPTPETSRAVGTPLVAVPASARYETMHVTTRLSRVSLTDSVSGIRTPVSARSFGTPPAGGVRSPRTPLTARSAKIASPTSRRMEEPQTPEPNPRYLAPATPLRAFAIAAEEGGGPCAGEASPQKPPIKVFSERLLRKEDTMPPMPTGAAPVVITLPARESKKAKNPVPARATVPMQGCCSGSGSGPSSPILSAQRAPLSPSSGVRAAIIPGRAIAVRPPPSTPPREHRKVALWPVSGSSRPVSLLRGAGPALVRPLEDPRSSVGAVLRSPKEGDAARPASPERLSPPAMPSLSAPLVRPASPNRLSPAATARPLLNPSPSMPRLASQTSLTSFYSDRGDLQRRPGTVRVPAPSALLQRGVPPERWGISLDQLCEIENEKHFAAEHTTREVVQHVIWPMTIGKGIGYALLRNSASPLQAAILVSHAWDDAFTDLLSALSVSEHQGIMWVASTALYQSEEAISQILCDPSALLNPVLRSADCMLCVLSTNIDVYERLWCLYEMAAAIDLGLEVNTTQKPKGRSAWCLDEAFLTACAKPVDSRSARCGPASASFSRDEQALRRQVETSKGFDEIDTAVEMARLHALTKFRDRLLGGGWSTTGIGKQYQDVIGDLCVRVGVHQPMPTSRPKNSMQISQFSPMPTNIKQELTPRTGFRQHWGKITTL